MSWQALFLSRADLRGLALVTDRIATWTRDPEFAQHRGLRHGLRAWNGASSVERIVDARWLFPTAALAERYLVVVARSAAPLPRLVGGGDAMRFGGDVREPITGVAVRSYVHAVRVDRVIARVYVRGADADLVESYSRRARERLVAYGDTHG